MTTLSCDVCPHHDLVRTPRLAGPLRRLAALMHSLERPLDAKELNRAAAALPVLEMAYARLTHFQELLLNPPRQMTRTQWRDAKHGVRDARAGVHWLHHHGDLPNQDTLVVNGVIAVLRTAAQGEQPLRVVKEAGSVLDSVGSHCAAIVLAEQDPIEEGTWQGPPATISARSARAALTSLAQASRIREYDDAEEQARIRLVEHAWHHTQTAP